MDLSPDTITTFFDTADPLLESAASKISRHSPFQETLSTNDAENGLGDRRTANGSLRLFVKLPLARQCYTRNGPAVRTCLNQIPRSCISHLSRNLLFLVRESPGPGHPSVDLFIPLLMAPTVGMEQP
jgi:hypothetical protein